MDHQEGQVFICKHCRGKGTCRCTVCKKKAGFNSDDEYYSRGVLQVLSEPPPCSCCNGQGKVWIGPAL